MISPGEMIIDNIKPPGEEDDENFNIMDQYEIDKEIEKAKLEEGQEMIEIRDQQQNQVNGNGEVERSLLNGNVSPTQTGPEHHHHHFLSDSRSRRKQIMAGAAASYGAMLNGMTIAYSGAANSSLVDPEGRDIYSSPFFVDMQTLSLITASMSVGSLVGSLCSGHIIHKIGPKRTLNYISTPLFLLGYLLVLLAPYPHLIMFGRMLTGGGLGFTICAMNNYLVEIATVDMRGFLGCFATVGGVSGLLITYMLTMLLDWKGLALVTAIVSLPYFFVLLFIPECPRFYMTNGRQYSARKSLLWLRAPIDTTSIDAELLQLKKECEHHTHNDEDKDSTTKAGVSDKTKRVASKARGGSIMVLGKCWRQFLISLAIMSFFILSGTTVTYHYAVLLFDMTKSALDPKHATPLIGVASFIGAIASLYLVRKLRRRTLLMISLVGGSAMQFALSTHLWINSIQIEESHGADDQTHVVATNLTEASTVNVTTEYPPATSSITEATFENAGSYIPVVTIVLFVFMVNIGLIPLMWIVSIEVIPPYARSIVFSASMAFSFAGGAVMSKSFVDLITIVGLSGTFFMYGVATFVFALFVLLFIPETFNKPSDEIQKSFKLPFSTFIRRQFSCTG